MGHNVRRANNVDTQWVIVYEGVTMWTRNGSQSMKGVTTWMQDGSEYEGSNNVNARRVEYEGSNNVNARRVEYEGR